MPEIDSVTGMLSMPWWMAAVLAGCALFLLVFAILRNGTGRTLGGLAGLAAIALAVSFAWTVHERMAASDRALERRALDARLTDLTLRTQDSPLACLAASAGETVDAACEKALFATPETVAAAAAYAEARLNLLADAADFAARGNDYEQSLATLRRPVETDRFGFFARAFSARVNCAPDACDAAELLLDDPSRILANLKEDAFQSHVERHAAAWGQPLRPGPAAAAMHPGPSVTTTANFPTADSIPPVSIMNNEPGMPGQNGVDNTAKQEPARPAAAQQARRPAAKRAADPAPRTAEPAPPAGSPGFPVPIGAPPSPPTRPATAAAPQPLQPQQLQQ